MNSRITRVVVTAMVAVVAIATTTLAGVDDYLGQSEHEPQLLTTPRIGSDDVQISAGAYFIIPRVGAVGALVPVGASGAIPICIGTALPMLDLAATDPTFVADQPDMRVWVDGQLAGCASA